MLLSCFMTENICTNCLFSCRAPLWLYTDRQQQSFGWLTRFMTPTKSVQNWNSWFYVCEHNVHVNNGVYRRSDWALSQNREVIVQLVSLQSLFIRGVKAGGYCLSPATGPLLHVHDCNEQKVTLADNCQQTRVSPQTSIIPPAAQFTSLCPFFLPLFPFCSFLFLSFLFLLFFLLHCNYSLSSVVNLAPPLPYLWLGRTRVSWVRRQGEQKEEEERESWK